MSTFRRLKERSYIDMILAEASGVVSKAEDHASECNFLVCNMRLKVLVNRTLFVLSTAMP